MKKHLLSMAFALSMIVSISGISAKAVDSPANSEFFIDTPYVYPVVPGTDAWAELPDNLAMMTACQIPEDLLHAMTTDALMQTVLDCPLFSDILAYDSFEEGFSVFSSWFNGVQELLSRPDAEETVISYLPTESILRVNQDEENTVKYLYSSLILKSITGDEDQKAEPLYLRRDYVDTPNGTPVEVIVGYTFEEHDPLWEQILAFEEESYARNYPDSIELAEASPEYNCHSYAWYWPSILNDCWMKQPDAYVEDGSYEETSNPSAMDRVAYRNAQGTITHSALVVSTSSGKVMVESKWGFGKLYKHEVDKCPYKERDITYWTLA